MRSAVFLIKRRYMLERIWNIIEKNCQRVAEEQQLVEEGEEFKLTDDQKRALDYLTRGIEAGKKRLLLKAPTGSGKTEVMMRLGVSKYMRTSRPVLVIAPTRDLCRQHSDYLSERLRGTGFGDIVLINGGMEPRKRDAALRQALTGDVAFVVASAMVIDNPRYRSLWDEISLLVIDDVNAFNEDEHLRHLKKFRGQILYQSATPEAVAYFLKSDGAWQNSAEMTQMPFDTLPTAVQRQDVSNYRPLVQLGMARERIEEHIAKGSRIFIIARLKRDIAAISEYLEKHYSVPVLCLHGDMADSKEHARRNRTRPGGIKTKLHRITMMNTFRNTRPSILVSTNLIGSGIDIPMADFIIITDSHSFSESEKEQLIGRVGRRERESDALLLEGDSPAKEKELKRMVKFSTRPSGNGRVRYSFGPRKVRGRR